MNTQSIIKTGSVQTHEYTFNRLPYRLSISKRPLIISFATMLAVLVCGQWALSVGTSETLAKQYGNSALLVQILSTLALAWLAYYTVRDFYKTCIATSEMDMQAKLANLWLTQGNANSPDLSGRVHMQQSQIGYMNTIQNGNGIKLYAICKDENSTRPYLIETEVLNTGEVKSTYYTNVEDIRSLLVMAFGTESEEAAVKCGIELDAKPAQGATRVKAPAPVVKAEVVQAPAAEPVVIGAEALKVIGQLKEETFQFSPSDFNGINIDELEGLDVPAPGVFGKAKQLRAGARNRVKAAHNPALAPA